MPGETGLGLLKELRAGPVPHRAVPAVALTAYARPEERDAILAAGFDAHVAKPIDPETLLAVLVDLSTGRSHDRASPPA